MSKFLSKLTIVCLLANINNAYAFEKYVWCGVFKKSVNVSTELSGYVPLPAIYLRSDDIEARGTRQFCGTDISGIPVGIDFSDKSTEQKWIDEYDGETIMIRGYIDSGRLNGYKALWMDNPKFIKIID